MIARAALVVTAVVVLAWVAVLLRDLYVGRRAEATLSRQEVSELDRNRALEEFEDARFLNPDIDWDLVRATRELGAGRRESARRLVSRLVEQEPDNFRTWALLRLAVRQSDPALARRAEAEVRRLDPFFRVR